MDVKPTKWQDMLRAIAKTEDDELSCQGLTDARLYRYIETKLADEDADTQQLQIEHHLSQCRDCASELADIHEVLRLDQANELIATQTEPHFDLSFLPAVEQVPIMPNQIQQALESGRRWVRDAQGVLWVDAAARLLGQSPLQPVLVTRGQRGLVKAKSEKKETEQVLYQLTLGKEEMGDLDLEIHAIAGETPEQCTLIMQVRVPSRWPDMSGVEVTVLRAQEIRSGQTDAEGQIEFENFSVSDLDRMGFKIVPTDARS